MRSFKILIEHQCPQCGAPATLTETDRLFTCEFCRVKSYLMARDYFRYMLPCKAAGNRQLVFFPYWRFKGMLFSCIPEGIRHKFVDLSHQAVRSQHFPISVGLRSQALKLQFVSPETEGFFLKPTQSLDTVMQTFEKRFGQTLPKPLLYRCHVGETLNLLYSPFYIDNRVFDAILNRPVSARLPDDFEISQFSGGTPSWRIRFISTLCPDCGWDLEGERDTLVLGCKNCNSAWYPVEEKLVKLKFARISDHGNDGIQLPFWRIRAKVSGIVLKSYADLLKVANLPKVAQNGWEDIGFRFWIPAFKVRPQVFLRLATHLTLIQPQDDLIETLPATRHHPITLPVAEAVESLKINVASYLKPRKHLVDVLPEIKINAESFMLVYVPFSEEHHEFIQQRYNLAINKNVLSLSKNL